MDRLARQALHNISRLVASLGPNETIDRETLIERLRAPLPDVPESEATLRHAYRHYVLKGGVRNAQLVVTYAEAAELADKSVEAVRQAAHRGRLLTTTEYILGRERKGVYLDSLRDWLGWSHDDFEEAVRQAETARRADLGLD